MSRTGEEPDPPPAGGRSDEELLRDYARALAEGIQAALPGWVAASVMRRLPPGFDRASIGDAVDRAGQEAVSDVGVKVARLLALDIDEQWTNPLSIIRSAIRYPTEVLSRVGVDPVARDEQARRFLPDDVYDLAPGAFADLHPDLHDLGISWGAAKAHIHLQRRRAEEVR